jgi:VanZ family protein
VLTALRAGLARVPLRLWRVIFWSCTAAVLFLALRPQPAEPMLFNHLDKLQHAAAFAVLTALGWLAGWRRPGRLGLALVGLGVLIEVLQMLTKTRQGEVADALADAVGVALALWALSRSGQQQEDRR